MRLLLDTQILVWMVNGDKWVRAEWVEVIVSPENSLHVSAVVAFEYSDLQLRQRIAIEEPISELMERFDFVAEIFPADAWRITSRLPLIHRDPVDRMLIAHTLNDECTREFAAIDAMMSRRHGGESMKSGTVRLSVMQMGKHCEVGGG